MPTARPRTNERDPRRARIVALLGKRAVRSQAELQDLLRTAGFDVNQGTLSRDLRDLGVVKGKDGYELPTDPNTAPVASDSLWHAVRTWLVAATPAENLVVLHTPAGGAQALGLALDKSELPELVGTIAGDDTVLAVCKTNAKARSLAKKLAASMQRPNRQGSGA